MRHRAQGETLGIKRHGHGVHTCSNGDFYGVCCLPLRSVFTPRGTYPSLLGAAFSPLSEQS